MKKAMVLRATTPPMTPPATATVDWTEGPFEDGTALMAPLVVLVDPSVACSDGAVPMVVNRGLAPAVAVGEPFTSEICCTLG